MLPFFFFLMGESELLVSSVVSVETSFFDLFSCGGTRTVIHVGLPGIMILDISDAFSSNWCIKKYLSVISIYELQVLFST